MIEKGSCRSMMLQQLPFTLCPREGGASADHPADEIDDQWDRDAGDANKVDDNAGTNHLGHGDIAGGVDDGIWRR